MTAERGNPITMQMSLSSSSESAALGEKYILVLLGSVQNATYPLPNHGTVEIGRLATSDIRLDEPSISRRHARLVIAEKITVEDLGSANGTRVRGKRLAPQQPIIVEPGDALAFGVVSALVQRLNHTGRPKRLWPHGYFEGRVEDECVRARRDHGTFAVVALHCDTASAAAQDALVEILRPMEVGGRYGAGEYEILLMDVDPTVARTRVDEISNTLALRGVKARLGLACWPADATSADELISRATAAARGERPDDAGDGQIVVRDAQMRRLHALIRRIAPGDISVILLGETGTGKEVLAERLHVSSPRTSHPFIRLNCAAITETLLENELFGHEPGAFTGATAVKRGLLESANGGTVFLDEVGEMPLGTQVKLLRVLEERKVMRVGGLVARPIDVRFVSATNRDLEAEIERGTFRQDLFYRLAGISLVIPPLRERADEIQPLITMFLQRHAEKYDRRVKISSEALAIMQRYSWPGNIRELRNVVDRAVLLAGDGVIEPEHLPLEKMLVTYDATPPARAPVAANRATPTPARQTRPVPLIDPSAKTPVPEPRGWWHEDSEDHERARVIAALEQAGGNQSEAARLLGISRRTLVNRLEQFALPRPRKGRQRRT